jgi:hypothetical protein
MKTMEGIHVSLLEKQEKGGAGRHEGRKKREERTATLSDKVNVKCEEIRPRSPLHEAHVWKEAIERDHSLFLSRAFYLKLLILSQLTMGVAMVR